MKSKEQLKNIAKQILYYEGVIETNDPSDKMVQSAKDNIEKIILSLTLEEMFQLDEFIAPLTR
jgi:hypothetical protein